MACFTEREQVEVETAAELSYAKIEDSSPPEGMAFACAGALGADPRELISQFASSASWDLWHGRLFSAAFMARPRNARRAAALACQASFGTDGWRRAAT